MKKRMLTALLAVVMAVTALVVPAGAAETVRFSDVTDSGTAVAVESLRLMGVLDGYGDGTFRPNNQLTRAQFCKMVTYAVDGANELGRYRTVTVFPDVKPSHWAAGYINLAAKGKSIIAGYPDGKFYPDRTVTVGQAVTILLRLLGYKDEDIGGVWPDSYMAAGAMAGLTDGITAGGNSPLTRAQAARLFVNLLRAEKPGSGTLYTLSEETELSSLDGSTGEMKTTDGKVYSMVHPHASTSLVGARGSVVLNENGKALTFLPVTSGNAGTANAAVVVYEDRSSAGFSALAGTTNYSIYKNGISAGLGDLRKNDVATYYAATNSIRVCDTRVTVYYESCEPSPSAPTKIKALNGTEFSVLPTAMDSLAAFKPGDQITLLLTADGQVAAAAEPGSGARGNAVGVVSADGTVRLLCGSTMLELAGKAEEKYYGKVVRVSSSKKGEVNLSVMTGGVSGNLDVTARTLGNKKLAENVMIFENGKLTSLSQITSGIIKESEILCARTNWAGDVDLIALGSSKDATVIYGRAVVRQTTVGEDEDAQTTTTIEVVYGNGQSTGEIRTGYVIRNGAYVAATLSSENRFTSLSELTRLKNVSGSAWTGKTAVTFGGRTYTVPSDVLCYNADSKEWTTLDKGLAYASTMDLYVRDGVVRVVEVSH